MDETVDGDYQTFKSRDGAYIREHFFGKYPETAKLVEDWTDAEIWALRRGGHDPQKVYAAFDRAVKTDGQPTVLLVKTVKGYGMGDAGEGQNITHQQKKLAEDQLKAFRDRFDIPVPEGEVAKAPYVTLGNEQKDYILKRREALGGAFPVRRHDNEPLEIPDLSLFDALLEGHRRPANLDDDGLRPGAERALPRQEDRQVRGADRAGREPHLRHGGACSASSASTTRRASSTRRRTPTSSATTRRARSGQVLQEGINEAGAMADWIAAATAYSVHGVPMIPFYIYYSMFGFQRVGDLAWAAGDSRARGFLLGGTAGRTTLNGEGLQHEDGHSHILAGTIPNCITYDPVFGYEVAVIVQDGLRRMFVDQEDVYFYLTVCNENYHHPAMPEGVEQGIVKGLYRFSKTEKPGRQARQPDVLGHDLPAGDAAPRSCSRPTSASPPTSGSRRA